MILGIDASLIFSDPDSSAAAQQRAVVVGLARLQPDWRILLFYPAKSSRSPFPAAESRRCDEALRGLSNVYLAPIARSANAQTWHEVRLPLALRENDVQVMYFPRFCASLPQLLPTVVNLGFMSDAALQRDARQVVNNATTQWLAPSSSIADEWRRLTKIPQQRIRQVNPALPDEECATTNAFAPILNKLPQPFVLHVAEANAAARTGYLLRAMERLSRSRRDSVHWLFVGELRDELNRPISEARLRDRVPTGRMLPAQPWQNIRSLLAASASVVHIADTDREAVIPLHAHRNQVPLLTSLEFESLAVNDNNVVCCDGGDVESIARHLSVLIEKSQLPRQSSVSKEPTIESQFIQYCQTIAASILAARRDPLCVRATRDARPIALQPPGLPATFR